jgi:hypothetical protein
MLKRLFAVFGAATAAACQLAAPHATDAEIEAAMLAHGGETLLMLAVATERGEMGMSLGFDMWWRLCEGRWTTDVQKYLPNVTDAGMLAFLKRYAKAHRHESSHAYAARINGRAGYVLRGNTWVQAQSADAVDPQVTK